MFELMQGDCLELMKGVPDGSVDLIITDPPYGMNYQSGRRTVSPQFEKIKGDGNVMGWLPNVLDEMNRVLKEDTAVYMFASWHNIDIFKSEFEKKIQVEKHNRLEQKQSRQWRFESSLRS